MSGYQKVSIFESDGRQSSGSETESQSGMNASDWLQTVNSPLPFRVGNSSVRLRLPNLARLQFLLPAFVLLLTCCALFILLPNSDARYTRGITSPRFKTIVHEADVLGVQTFSAHSAVQHDKSHEAEVKHDRKPCADEDSYNSTYPMTAPTILKDGSKVFVIGIISDLDAESKSKKESFTWMSHFLKGSLTVSPNKDNIQVKWNNRITLKESLSQGGRGMELSELIVFNGKLYAVDDRTGIVYQIDNDKVYPWVVLPDGDGKSPKGNAFLISDCLHLTNLEYI